ncbi:MAG: hypothetical protein K8Q91_01260 [Candidatus Vogelbacteria bacterium]|nr:hypothetical protein [Candidatus Vogelbacteria bacterium]
MDKKPGRTVAFDFDGVIANYSGFKGKDHAEEPIGETIKAIKLLKEKEFKILLHSTRGDDFLRNYCTQYDIPFDYINRRPDKEGDNPGKPIAYVYVDDRSICFKGQKAEELVEEIDNFKAYWEE